MSMNVVEKIDDLVKVRHTMGIAYQDFFVALALLFVFEGMLPFLS